MTEDNDDGAEWHLIPQGEVEGHDHDEDCWCDPTFKGVSQSGAKVFLHHGTAERTLQ